MKRCLLSLVSVWQVKRLLRHHALLPARIDNRHTGTDRPTHTDQQRNLLLGRIRKNTDHPLHVRAEIGMRRKVGMTSLV